MSDQTREPHTPNCLFRRINEFVWRTWPDERLCSNYICEDGSERGYDHAQRCRTRAEHVEIRDGYHRYVCAHHQEGPPR